MTPAEHLDNTVRLAMQAYDSIQTIAGDRISNERRQRFEVAVRERLAQAAQVVACDLDEAKGAGAPKMRAWLATFPGHYVGGHAVLVAADETHALVHLAARFRDVFPEPMRHRTERIDRTLLAPVHLDSEGVSSFYNGDY